MWRNKEPGCVCCACLGPDQGWRVPKDVQSSLHAAVGCMRKLQRLHLLWPQLGALVDAAQAAGRALLGCLHNASMLLHVYMHIAYRLVASCPTLEQ